MAWVGADQYRFEVSSHHELVFSLGICYLPMAKIFMLLVAIMDWYPCRVLAWQISDTLDIGLCGSAGGGADVPWKAGDLLNTDQD